MPPRSRPWTAFLALALVPAGAPGAPDAAVSVETFQARYRRTLPEEARKELIVALGRSGDRRVPGILGRLLPEERSSPFLQAWLVKTLCEEAGSPEALKQVSECLGNRRLARSVALVAQSTLANVRSEEGLAWMASEGLKDPASREAMAWGLAWNPAYRDPEAFLAHLPAAREKDWRLRAAAAAGLGRIGDPAAAGDVLDAATAEKSGPVLRHLLPAAGRLASRDAMPILESALASPDFRVRLGALEGLGHCARSGSLRSRALALLLSALGKEPGRLRADAARILEGLTGKRHGLDASAWRAALQELVADLPSQDPPSSPAPEYLGIPLPSRRIVFLIEASEEMGRDRQSLQPVDRLVRARRELARMLETLPPEACFGLAAFGPSAQRWREDLAHATPEVKKAALAWADSLGAMGHPDLGAGLASAWTLGLPAEPRQEEVPEDLGADTLVILSNGAPPSGLRGEPLFWGDLAGGYDLRRWIMVESRNRSVVIHAVGVSSGGDKAVLQDLAAQTGGLFRNID